MMPAVGNAPVITGMGAGAMGQARGGSEAGIGFAPVMQAALADASQRQLLAGQAAQGKIEARKPGMDSGAGAAQGVVARGSGKVATDAAGTDGMGKDAPAMEAASREVAGSAAVMRKEGAAQTLPAPEPPAHGDATTSSAVKVGEPVGLVAAAKVAAQGMPAVAAAMQAVAGAGGEAHSVEGEALAKDSAGAVAEPDAAAGKGAKTDSKKADMKGAGAAQTAVGPAGMALPVVLAAGAVPVSPAESMSAHHGMKGDGGTVAASVGRGIAAASGHAAGRASRGIAQPTAETAVDSQASRAVQPNAGWGSSSEGSAGSIGKISPAQHAEAGAAMRAGAPAGLAAHAGHDAQQRSAQGGQSGMIVHAQNGPVKGWNAEGPASHGFTATLLTGHPAVGTAVSHAQAHGAGADGSVGAANPYARMDETQGHSLVYASPQKMAVTVSDPSLGSFQVRAQSTGAQVAASLATASASAHAQLSGHLPSLTAFLQEQRLDLARVTVVQQSLLGGESGAQESGGRQRQGRSGSQREPAQAGGVGAVESAGSAGSGGPAAGSVAVSGTAAVESGSAAAMGMDGRPGMRNAGRMGSVDVHV